MSECTHDCSSCSSNCADRKEPQSFLKPMNKNSNIKKVIGVVSGKGGVGKRLIRRRRQFVEELSEIVTGIHRNISGKREELVLRYEPNIDAEFLEDELNRVREKDRKYAQTSVGPHRDDISFFIRGVDIRKFGSQGQQRTSALSLKLSEIELVRQTIHDTPVLLLDDVLSELDSNRQNYLLNSIHDIQTMITCTGLDEFVRNRFQIDKVFHVIDGHVSETTEM